MNFRVPPIDQLRAAIVMVVNALFPMLQIFSIIDWSGDQLAAVNTVITTLMALVFLFFRPSSSD